jgi:tight adherence protein B
MNTVPLLLAADAGNPTTRLIIAAVMGGAVLCFMICVWLINTDKRSDLEKRLTGFGVGEEEEVDEEDLFGPREQQFAESKFTQDLVGLTGRLADRVGLLNRVEDKLEQADLPLRPPEALFFYFVAFLIVFVASFLLFGIGAGLICTLFAGLAPWLFLEFRRKARLRKFENQLPDTLGLLAGSMRAGFSFAQGLEAVAEEASEPSRRELQRVFAESRLGRPIEDALEDSANRMASVDLLWAVMAIRIQREVGGNLAELLDTVANTMTQRERLRREIMSLTAEGRLSAWVLGIFPPAFAVVLFVIQPDYMSALFSEAIGIVAVGVSAVMAFFGFLWLRKMMKIEV